MLLKTLYFIEVKLGTIIRSKWNHHLSGETKKNVQKEKVSFQTPTLKKKYVSKSKTSKLDLKIFCILSVFLSVPKRTLFNSLLHRMKLAK